MRRVDKGKRMKRACAYLLALALLLGFFPERVGQAKGAGTTSVYTYYGENRFDTAAKLAEANFKGVKGAILVNSDGFADALSALNLQGGEGRPILYSLKNKVHPRSLEALRRIGAREVYLLGGEAVLSAAVEKDLRYQGFRVIRLAGKNRYETNQKTLSYKKGKNLVVASGENFPDALVSAALLQDGKLLLSPKKGRLTDAMGDALKNAQRVIVLGGAAAIEESLYRQMAGKNVHIARLYGDTRYETAQKVFQAATNKKELIVTTGGAFPDALSAGALSVKKNCPIALFDQPNPLRAEVNRSAPARLHIVGGVTLLGQMGPKEVIRYFSLGQEGAPDPNQTPTPDPSPNPDPNPNPDPAPAPKQTRSDQEMIDAFLKEVDQSFASLWNEVRAKNGLSAIQNPGGQYEKANEIYTEALLAYGALAHSFVMNGVQYSPQKVMERLGSDPEVYFLSNINYREVPLIGRNLEEALRRTSARQEALAILNAYLVDFGPQNQAEGHRKHILSPRYRKGVSTSRGKIVGKSNMFGTTVYTLRIFTSTAFLSEMDINAWHRDFPDSEKITYEDARILWGYQDSTLSLPYVGMEGEAFFLRLLTPAELAKFNQERALLGTLNLEEICRSPKRYVDALKALGVAAR